MESTKTKKSFVNILVTVILVAVSTISILPFVWMVAGSFKKPLDVMSLNLIPKYIYLKNYEEIFSGTYNFLTMYMNSIKVTTIIVVTAVFTSCMAGYGFARLKFPGRDKIFILYLMTMMIPAQSVLVPKFVIFSTLGMTNNYLSLILPGAFTIFGTFLMRQFFLQVPFELSEAARIDGAGEFRTWWSVIMPMAKPAIATLVIIVFSWHWNDYENPLIFLSKKKMFTVPLGLNLFRDENVTFYNLIVTAATLSVLPMFAVFIGFQRYFIQGLSAGAVKG